MCQPASMIVRKEERPYWSPNTESHEDMIRELGLQDNTLDPQFVRVEIVPLDGNMLAPLTEWRYRLDQDFRPEWYDAADAEAQVRTALVDWAAMKLIRDGVHKVQSGNRYFSGNARGYFYGNSRGYFSGNATGTFSGNARGYFSGNARGYFYGNATGYFSGNATGNAAEEATINQWSAACRITLEGRAVNIRRDKAGAKVCVELAKPNRSRKAKK